MKMVGYICEIEGKLTIEWKIKHLFSLYDKINSYYKSPEFHFLGNSWELHLYPNGQTKTESVGWIGVYLKKISSGSSVTLDYSLDVKSTERTDDYCFNATSSVFDDGHRGRGYHKIISRSVLMDKKSELSHSNEITIICTMKNCPQNDVAGNSYITSRLNNEAETLFSVLGS